MSTSGDTEGDITRAELAELAALFDQFEFAFDPLSLAAREAESRFDDQVRSLFDQRIGPKYPEVDFTSFYCKVKSACRAYLRKQLRSQR